MSTEPYTTGLEIALPQWASDESNNVEPPGTQKETGWTNGQLGDSSFMNWWMFLVYTWISFLRAAIHWAEPWFCETSGLGAGGDALGTTGWAYGAASATGATIEDPTALHPRRFAKLGNNNGIGSSRLRSRSIHFHTATSHIAMEGRVSISGFGTSTGYSYEWGVDSTSSNFIHRVVIKKKNGSANWWLHVQNATGTTELDLGVACVAGQAYVLRIYMFTGNVLAYVDGVYRGAITGSANYPGNRLLRFMFQTVETSNLAMGYLSVEGFRAWFDDPA